MMENLIFGVYITKILGNVFYFMLALICFDVVTGLLASAKERKLNSSVNFDGFIKKIGELVGLLFMSLVDGYFQVNGLIMKTGAGLLIIYEALSVIENLSRIGVKLTFLTKYFDPEKLTKGEDKNENL